MGTDLRDRLDLLPLAARVRLLMDMLDELIEGRDETLRAFRAHADVIPAVAVLIGGVAVIQHGYQRTTKDRDVLLSHRDAPRLADRLMDDPDWERLEIRQYAFRYVPTGVQLDFLVSRDLIQMGRPYFFPEPVDVEQGVGIEGIPVIGFHDLLFLKLLAGRMQDLADIVELCKRNLGQIEPERVLARLHPEDGDLLATFQDLLARAPRELDDERRLGQND
jgi:hypothetical protein